MADKSGLSGLAKTKLTPAYGLEEGETDDAVERATQRVMQAYMARQNLGYDPTLMAFGQAMLSSRGNFGEGLGAGFKGAQEAQQLIRQQDIEDAQAQLMMAQAEREQQNAIRAQKAFGLFTGGDNASEKMPEGGISLDGQQASTPSGGRVVSVQDALKFATMFPNQEKKAAMLMDAAKLGQDRFTVRENGIFDAWANGGRGGYLDIQVPGQKPDDYLTVGGTFRMTPSQNDKYQLAANAGLAKEWIEAYKAGKSTREIEYLAANKKMPPAVPKAAPAAVTPAAETKAASAAGYTNNFPATPQQIEAFVGVKDESGRTSTGATVGAPVTSDKPVKSLAPVNTGGEQGGSEVKPAVSPAAAAEPSALAPRAAPIVAAPVTTSAATSAAAPAAALSANRFSFNAAGSPSFVASSSGGAGAILSGSTASSGIMSKEAQALQQSERELSNAIAQKDRQGIIDAQLKRDQAQLDFNRELALKENASRIKTEEDERAALQKEDLERKAELRKKADVGRTAKNFARQFRAISEDPSADKILGAFSDNSVFSAIVNLAQSGVGVTGYSIGIQDLAPILRNLNLDPKEMQKAQIMGMLIAQMQLSKGKMLSGSTSNYDLALMGQSGVTDKDTRLTVRAKADMIERQAQYHEDLEEMLDDWKGNMSAFNRSKKVKELSDKFNEDLIKIINGELKYSNPAKAADAKPAQAKAAASGGKKQENKKISSEDALKKLVGGDK